MEGEAHGKEPKQTMLCCRVDMKGENRAWDLGRVRWQLNRSSVPLAEGWAHRYPSCGDMQTESVTCQWPFQHLLKSVFPYISFFQPRL